MHRCSLEIEPFNRRIAHNGPLLRREEKYPKRPIYRQLQILLLFTKIKIIGEQHGELREGPNVNAFTTNSPGKE